MKKELIILFSLLCSTTLLAQKIDFNMTGRSEAEGTEPGYTPWAVTETASATGTFDGITITLSPDTEYAGIHVLTKYWKQGVVNMGYKLIGDGLAVYGDDHSNITSGAVKLDVKIEGLSAGHHSVQAFHNNVEGLDAPKMDVYVNGVKKLEGIEQTNRKTTESESGKSYVEFDVTDGQTIVVSYVTTPESGKTYGTTTVTLNALIFNQSDNSKTALNPVPSKSDMHVDADDGSLDLQWEVASSAVKHHVWLGTSETDMLKQGITTSTHYTVNGLKSMNTYYWRVDEEDASGNVTTGEVWTFKPRQLAFPEAEGYGRYAIGGRGGSVYHVTSLSGGEEPGTLLYGLLHVDEPHYIVFDVSGIIELDFNSHFTKSNITIAGQTAPGKGICIKASNIGLGSDVICQHMRFKRGLGVYGENTGNALGAGNDYTILDHTTAAWGSDETFSSRGAKNLTFQYSMITEALGITGHKNYDDGKNHGIAATIGGSVGSFSHNLLVNCNGRNWSMGGGLDGAGNAAGELDMFNNVCYNWGGRTTDGGALHMQFVNNYYKMGEASSQKKLFIAQNEDFGNTRQQFAYVSGNIRENKNHTLTTDKKGDTYDASGPDQESTWYDAPFFPSEATIHSAKDALKIVTSYAGATMPQRDEQHLRNVKETLSGTWTYKGSKSGIKGEIDTEEDITEHAAGKGWENYPEEHRAADWDTDQDGMPDWWEQMIGSNASVANHNDDPNHDGWTLLDDYLDFMAHPYVMVKPGESGTMDVKPFFAGFYGQNSNYDKTIPSYTVATESSLFAPSVEGSLVKAMAGQNAGFGYINVTVNDGETTWSQRLGVAVTGTSTGIQTLNLTQHPSADAPLYDLQGRRVEQPMKGGLYIQNGKKFIVK